MLTTIRTALAGAWGTELRATAALSGPIILTNFAQIAITTTDVVMMGWLSPRALAAGTLGVNLYYAVFVVGVGIAMAVAPMLAHELGRNRFAVRELRRTVRQGLWATTLVAAAAWLVLWHTEVILAAMGQDPELAADAGRYMRAMQWGLLPYLWFFTLRSFIAALERPLAGLVVTAAAILLNALLCWALMFGKLGAPAFGLAGAGIASSIAAFFMFASLQGFIACDRRFRRYALLGRFWRADGPRFREVWWIGAPVAATFLFEVGVFNVAVFTIGLIDADQLAANAIAFQIASVTFMVPMGIAQAATVRVGLAAGAGDTRAIARSGWIALTLGGSFMTAMAILLVSAPQTLAGFFLDLDDPAARAVLPYAIVFIGLAGLFQIADGLQSIGAGCLRGLKDTRTPMLFAGVGYWVAGLPIGLGLAFGLELEGTGIWIGLASGLGFVAALMVARWSRRARLGLVPAG